MEQKSFKELKKRKIQLFSKLRLRSIFPGEWESIWKGSGIEFTDIKPFETGDDLREIDLPTLIQANKIEIIQRVVERQLKVSVWADFRGSMQRTDSMFFPSKAEIRDIAIGLCLFSAQKLYCPVGLCAFDKKIKEIFLPRVGERYCWHILNWIIENRGDFSSEPTDFSKILSFLTKKTSRQSLVFMISDFKAEIFDKNFTTLLIPLVNKFDFIPIVVRDPLEKNFVLKKTVRIAVQDTEGNQQAEIYLSPKKLKEIQRASDNHLRNLKRNFKKMGIDYVVLDSPSIDDCHRKLLSFFQARRRLCKKRF